GAWAIALFGVIGLLVRGVAGFPRAQPSTIALLLVAGVAIGLMELAIGKIFASQTSPLALALLIGMFYFAYRAIGLWRIRTVDGDALFHAARDLRRSLAATAASGPGGARDADDAGRLLPYAL